MECPVAARSTWPSFSVDLREVAGITWPMAKDGGVRLKTILGWVALGAVLLVLTGVEACYFLHDDSTLKRDAALTWIIISAGFLLFVPIYAFGFFLQSAFWRDKDRFWYLAAFFLPLGLIYFDVAGVRWTSINCEGTQQMAQGVAMLHQDSDFGVYRIAYFVGYVARQYLLACLPSYIFGPSLVALRVGTSFLYVASYLAFLAAVAHYFRVRKAPNPLLLASFAGMMISLGEYPLVQARSFEQTMMPIGTMLLFLAGLFYFLTGPTPFRTFWLAWSFAFFAEGYTPALGGWWLALVILLYLILHPKYRYRILWVPVVYGICCLFSSTLILSQAATLFSRFQIGPPQFTYSDWIWRYFVGYHSLLSAGFSVIPCPLGLAALTVLYISFKFRDYRFPLLSLWCLAIAFVSLTFVGSYFNLPQFDIHRSMIILPPLAAGVVVFYHIHGSRLDASWPIHRSVVAFVCVSMIYMVCTGGAVPLTVRIYIYDDDIRNYDEALYRIQCVNFGSKKEKIKKLYLVPPLKIDDLETGLVYFAPTVELIRGNPPPGEKEPGAYVLSFLKGREADLPFDRIIPSQHARPYLQLKEE